MKRSQNMRFKSKKTKKDRRFQLKLKRRRKVDKSGKSKHSIKAKKILQSSRLRRQSYKINPNKSHVRKRVLVFLGAGATMCFGGAKSDTILEDIKTDQRFKTTDNVPIGQYLYDKLNETFGNQANFETVIASIELIITYHLAKTNDTENPNLKSIVPSFLIFNEDFLNKIDNFTLHEIPEHPDEVILEYFNNLVLQTFTLPRKTVRLFYYSKILNNFLSLISIRINQYAEGDSDYNLKFKNFVNYLISNYYHVNFFTTNYDNLIPKILEGRNVFNGFDGPNQDNSGLQYNSKKIIFNDSVTKVFNLHGSIFWHHEFLMDHMEYQFVFKPEEYNLPLFSKTDVTNPGEELVLSNIITGYNKTQRTLSPPFSLMIGSFIKECLRADVILIIGYSFSDNHLNKILSSPFNENSPRIVNITQSSLDYLRTPEGKKFTELLKRKFALTSPVIDDNFISSTDNRQMIYFSGLASFLDSKDNWKTIF